MKAIVVDPQDGKLIWTDSPLPELKENEILVKVHATAVNRADLLQKSGKYSPPPGASEIIGLEAAGTVEKESERFSEFKSGDRVFCLLAGGAYAEYVAVPGSHLMRIPANLNFEQAASIPEAFITAYLNLVIEGRLAAGETVLIHAAASGVGTAAVQIAHSMGAAVLATAGSEEKCEFVKSLGARQCVNYNSTDLVKHFGEGSINLILDMVGQRHFAANLSMLVYRGRLVMLSLISGARSEINLFPLLRKNLTLKGSTLRDRTIEEKAGLTDQFEKKLLPLFGSGKLKTTICKEFPIEQAQAAHDFVAANSNIGKVVLKVRDLN